MSTSENARPGPSDPGSGGPSASPDSDLFEREGDIDEDRQDAPRADKTGDDPPPLDGTRSTPDDEGESVA